MLKRAMSSDRGGSRGLQRSLTGDGSQQHDLQRSLTSDSGQDDYHAAAAADDDSDDGDNSGSTSPNFRALAGGMRSFVASQQADESPLEGKSLGLFPPDSRPRLALMQVVRNPLFDGFLLLLILANLFTLVAKAVGAVLPIC